MDSKQHTILKKLILLGLFGILIAMIVVAIWIRYNFRLDIMYWTIPATYVDTNTEITDTSVMSFNIRCITEADTGINDWSYRASEVVGIVNDNQPTIICMQECKRPQYRYLKKCLSGYKSVAVYRDNSYKKECLPIFYREDLYQLENTETFWLSDTPDVMSNTWGGYNRICTFVVLKEKLTNKRLLVANTHLDHKVQEAQLKGINLIYKKLSQYNLPSLIMGDFNCKPNADAIIKARKYYTDASAGSADANKGTVNYFKSKYPNKKIDYIFTTKYNVRVLNYKVIDTVKNGIYASDHFPIMANVEII